MRPANGLATLRTSGIRALLAATFAAPALLGAAPVTLAPASPPSPPNCAPTIYPAAGTFELGSRRRGPGLLLSGAGGGSLMPAAALTWLRTLIGKSKAGRGGNVIVLRASGERDNTDRFYADGRFAWVEEILIPPCASRAALDELGPRVARADAIFFAGGDQSHYVAWNGSALLAAVREVYARGGVVGGGSAGLAIQGALGYDAVAATRLHPNDDDFAVHSADAVRAPLEGEISFTHLFDWPALRGTITDTHFAKRDRFGRLVAFLARAVHDGLASTPFYGLGVDEGSAVLVEADGHAILRKLPGSRGAYLVRLNAPVELEAGKPLQVTVDVAHVEADGERFDLLGKKSGRPWRAVKVDGARNPAYREAYR